MMFDAARELPGAKDFFKAPTLEIQYIGLTFIAGHDPPINLTTAKILDLAVPLSLLAIAAK
jgi:hypothetical protein